jgi:hypothetical protein
VVPPYPDRELDFPSQDRTLLAILAPQPCINLRYRHHGEPLPEPRSPPEYKPNTFLGMDGVRHHRDHLSSGTRPDDVTFSNDRIEEDETHTRTLGAGLTGRRMTELGGITGRVVSRFAVESLGHPGDTRVSPESPWR